MIIVFAKTIETQCSRVFPRREQHPLVDQSFCSSWMSGYSFHWRLFCTGASIISFSVPIIEQVGLAHPCGSISGNAQHVKFLIPASRRNKNRIYCLGWHCISAGMREKQPLLPFGLGSLVSEQNVHQLNWVLPRVFEVKKRYCLDKQ